MRTITGVIAPLNVPRCSVVKSRSVLFKGRVKYLYFGAEAGHFLLVEDSPGSHRQPVEAKKILIHLLLTKFDHF